MILIIVLLFHKLFCASILYCNVIGNYQKLRRGNFNLGRVKIVQTFNNACKIMQVKVPWTFTYILVLQLVAMNYKLIITVWFQACVSCVSTPLLCGESRVFVCAVCNLGEEYHEVRPLTKRDALHLAVRYYIYCTLKWVFEVILSLTMPLGDVFWTVKCKIKVTINPILIFIYMDTCF